MLTQWINYFSNNLFLVINIDWKQFNKASRDALDVAVAFCSLIDPIFSPLE